MIVEIVMPKMGESITEGTILEWKKNVGDYIIQDEILLEIGTDKVDSEIPCSAEGTVIEILANVNETVEVGKVIAKIDSGKGVQTLSKVEEPKEKLSNKNTIISKQETKGRITDESSLNLKRSTKQFYTPVVMRMAAENNVPITELEKVIGTGRGGRVTKKDFQLYINERSVHQENILETDSKPLEQDSGIFKSKNIKEISHMRKQISENMRQSLDTSAHVYVFNEVDMTKIVEYILKMDTHFLKQENFSLTVTPFIIDSVVKALKEYPIINSSLVGSNIEYHKNLNIGLAVAIDSGLLVPVIRNCEEKNFLGLCRSVNNLVSKTRSKTINPDDLLGSTFTITNFGVFGVRGGTPIINQPNVAILGVGAIKKQPIVIESDNGDSIAIRNMMLMTLGFDHRLIDGAGGAKFVDTVRKNLEAVDLSKLL
ncbi:MAG: diapophytoene dehydrogenase [Candidatus Marinimicrobia bacterium]|nr:diapophytoene dehydrogenase [Candidatus Neomarinimicrobiota bacterium]